MTERPGEIPRATFLDDVLVVELGQRLGAGVVGSLLAEAGAEVVSIEHENRQGSHSKLEARASLAAGKHAFRLHANDEGADHVAEIIGRADVVIVSSDSDPDWPAAIVKALKAAHLLCDITAFGTGRGPLAGQRDAGDPIVQALAGVMDTSGEPDGAPAFCAAPIIEMSAALYAASGVLAALRASRLQGVGQRVDVAIYDCAVGMLATFLPKNFAGGNARRVGNHHPAMSPWNAFAAKDGWVLLCAGTNDQWARVAKVIGQPALVTDPRFDTTTKRVANAADVDATIAPWIARLDVAACVDQLNAISISTGPILRVADLAREPNLAHRGMILEIADRASGLRVRVPGSPLRGSVARGVSPERVPSPITHPDEFREIAAHPQSQRRSSPAGPLKPPLAGVRVLEMGQFTTAPLVGRHLGALGADVAKLEPDGGEPAREMPPHKNGQGFFFSLSNSDTRVMTVDLRKPGRVELLTRLIEKADVLVENTKPGTLSRHGFTPERVLEINPRIVYCAISGFGIDAPSAGLGAMDTTIQGLAGIMDLTRVDGVPYKTGISIADLHAGQFALFATLAALEFRDRTGRGQVIDLAMLDAASWVTRTMWNPRESGTDALFRPVACRDGHVLVRTRAAPGQAADWKRVEEIARETDRQSLAKALDAIGIEAAPVQSVSEVLAHPQTTERGIVFEARTRTGDRWNLLACPIGLSKTPAKVTRVPGPLDADRDEILRDWNIAWRPPQASG